MRNRDRIEVVRPVVLVGSTGDTLKTRLGVVLGLQCSVYYVAREPIPFICAWRAVQIMTGLKRLRIKGEISPTIDDLSQSVRWKNLKNGDALATDFKVTEWELRNTLSKWSDKFLSLEELYDLYDVAH